MIDEIPIPSEQVKLFFMNLPFSKFLGLKLSRLGDGRELFKFYISGLKMIIKNLVCW